MTDIPRHELLLKLLKMTTSDNDAEALVAIRKANALLTAAGWDWEKLLVGKITVVGDPFGNLQRPVAAKANEPYVARAAPPKPQAQAPTQPQQYRARQRSAQPTINYDDIFGSVY